MGLANNTNQTAIDVANNALVVANDAVQVATEANRTSDDALGAATAARAYILDVVAIANQVEANV